MNKPKDTVTEIPLSEIRDFPDHPYQVRDDDSMLELVDSIKERGLIQPVLVRPVDDGYEMVSGHRRKRAYELAGIDLIPARVKELSRDEAILAMVDSNLQREQILPSEKAKAYEAGEVVILKIEDTGNSDEESYVSVEDDDTLQTVFEIFKEKFKDEFNFVD